MSEQAFVDGEDGLFVTDAEFEERTAKNADGKSQYDF